MNKFLTIGALTLTATMAQARIGWTLEQCKEQYGKALSVEPVDRAWPDAGPMLYTFKVGKTDIQVRIHDGVVYNIHYATESRSAPWTKNDVMQILLKNSNNTPWKLDKEMSNKEGTWWYTGKSKLYAIAEIIRSGEYKSIDIEDSVWTKKAYQAIEDTKKGWRKKREEEKQRNIDRL